MIRKTVLYLFVLLLLSTVTFADTKALSRFMVYTYHLQKLDFKYDASYLSFA
jgi:hypothetical protein